MQTVRNGEISGTFEPGCSSALEQIVENVHVHASKTKETLHPTASTSTLQKLIKKLNFLNGIQICVDEK
jgi:hypothetical protein